jgi:kinesin family protein 5
VFEGINGTAFTYGQTSSGKTYTCMGPDMKSEEHRGLIPRLIDEIFRKIE